MQPGEALDVHLVDQHLAPGHSGRPIVAPGEGLVQHGGQRREAGVVALVERQIGLRVAHAVAPHFVAPARLPGDGLGVGIEQDLVLVEAVAFGRLVGAVHAIAVNLPRQHVGQIGVPDHVGLLGDLNAVRFALAVGRLEQAQLDARGMLRVQGEVRPAAVPGGAQRIGPARPDSQFRRRFLVAYCHTPLTGKFTSSIHPSTARRENFPTRRPRRVVARRRRAARSPPWRRKRRA